MRTFLNQRFLYPVIIGILVFLSFSPALQNQFTNLDDDTHIVDNPKVQKLNLESVHNIFTRDFDRIIPLTILSFAVEKSLFGFNTFIFHLDNVLLHVSVCLLIYYLLMRLGLSEAIALILTLIFGLHPTKVESVAWATERKDVLYALFYVAAMHCHLSWIVRRKKRFYWLAVLAGLLSMMSKPAALSLPFVLFFMDQYQGRKFNDLWLEKVPYFFFIVPYVLLTFTVYKVYGNGSIFSGVLIWLWSLAFYLQKFFWPNILIPIYAVPKPVSIVNSEYFVAVLILILCGLIFWRFRKNCDVTFAFGLFFVPIFFVLHNNDTANINTVADRYLYLPSLGLSWLVVICFLSVRQHRVGKCFAPIFVVVLIFFFIFKTLQQSRVWHDNFSLWSHQLRFVPHESAYQNRGTAYYLEGKYPAAIDDFNKGLLLNPNYVKLYINRGLAYLPEGFIPEAIDDFTRALSFDKDNVTALNNRGVIYIKLKKFDDALTDFNHIIDIDPNNSEALSNRGVLYTGLGDFNKALKDLNASIALDRNNAEAIYNRGGVFYRQKKWDLAWKDFNRAVELQSNYVKALYYRGVLSYQRRDVDGALKDLSTVLRFDPVYVDAYVSRGIIWARKNKIDLALKDFNKALEINPQNRQAIFEKEKLLHQSIEKNE